MVENTREYCRTNLYIRGDDLDPQEVTVLLGTAPDESYRRGDRRLQRRPDGTPDPTKPTNYVVQQGRWRRAIEENKTTSWVIEDQLRYWCEFLSARKEAVRLLQSRGCEFEIDCYLDEGPVVYVELPSELIRTLAEMNIALKFGFYDWTSPEMKPKQGFEEE